MCVLQLYGHTHILNFERNNGISYSNLLKIVSDTHAIRKCFTLHVYSIIFEILLLKSVKCRWL